jgi:uncharacterized integral membrane protein
LAEPETSQPAAPSNRAAKRRWEGSGPGGLSWKAILLAALGVYALLLIIQNSRSVSVDFVFFSQQTRVIYLVLLCMALGALIAWLVPRMRQGRNAKRSSSDSKRADRGQGGISWKAIVLVALGIYALLLIILNSKKVSVDFVFVSQRTRVIWLVLLSMALGALIAWLVPRMRRGRKEKRQLDDPEASGTDISAHPG